MGTPEESHDELNAEIDRILSAAYQEELDRAVDEYIKQHKGRKILVSFFGGPYDGQTKLLRRPLSAVNEVAGPPKEESPGMYRFEWDYFTYYLRKVITHTEVVEFWYVHETDLVEFANTHNVT